MFDTRRRFLVVCAAAGALGALSTPDIAGQARPKGGPPTGAPSDPSAGDDVNGPLPEKSPTKAMLEANEKDIKKNIEKLYQLATDLKSEIEKTDSSQVLSLALLRKADEIEKLAHDIKTRAKG